MIETSNTLNMIDKLSLLLLLTFMLGGSSLELCVPTCTLLNGSSVEEGAKVAHPSNCFKFYICSDVDNVNGTDLCEEALDCPLGTYFDTKDADCTAIPENEPYCDDLCSPCNLECIEEDAGQIIPDPFDCSKYVICLVNGGHLSEDCDDGKLFDYTANECKSANETNCYDFCDPCTVYCVSEGRMPDPYDCRSYLYCEPPNQWATFSCVDGMKYDNSKEICVDDEEDCKPFCPDKSH